MDTNIYDTTTAYQKAEALECAIAILERWTELQPLTDPLKKERERLVRNADRWGLGEFHYS